MMVSMARQEEKDEKKDISNSEKKKDEKTGKLKDLLQKIARPLGESLIVLAAASTLSTTNCTTRFETVDNDAVEEDIGGEADQDEIGLDPDTIDITSEEVQEDISDADEEEARPVCYPNDEEGLVTLLTGDTAIVGRIGIEYNGLTTSNEGIYNILCDRDVIATENIVEADTRTIDLFEYGFQITLRVDSARAHATTVYVTVDAY